MSQAGWVVAKDGIYIQDREGNMTWVINASIRQCISLSAGPVGPYEG